MSKKILIVEDEFALYTLLKFHLEHAGYTPIYAATAEQAAQRLADYPHMALIDWQLPQMQGTDLVKIIRAHNELKQLPIIMLTARGDDADKEQAFAFGADDYLVKPFSPRELVARINALFRRTNVVHSTSQMALGTAVGELKLDPLQRTLMYNGAQVNLSKTECRLVHFFMRHNKVPYDRAQLLDLVWGMDKIAQPRTVDVHIKRLRATLATIGADGYLKTVRGLGYCFWV